MEDEHALRAYIERIAAVLHDHLDTTNDLEASIGYADSGGGSERVKEGLHSVSALRTSIIDSLERALEIAEQLGPDRVDKEDLLDLRALAAYYLEAGLWREITLGREAVRHAPSWREEAAIGDARRRVEAVLRGVERLLREAEVASLDRV